VLEREGADGLLCGLEAGDVALVCVEAAGEGRHVWVGCGALAPRHEAGGAAAELAIASDVSLAQPIGRGGIA
jgi:hypothetical protein